MKIPSELKHKPVIVSEDYDLIDGRYANNSDAKGLSLGLAQWNDRGSVDISAKIWRYTGEKWSRQSEEMPLHRVLDLAILIVKTRKVFLERYHKNEKDYPNYPSLDRIGLQGGAMNLAVCKDNQQIESDMDLFEATLAKDDEIIGERLNVLLRALNDLGL
ncbi:MAG: DUF6530 family protein [Candidatus Marinimicrobia bacterium]|nr:DUF6530 family protein [Candidatus Neomarinimicrobiota bacterium]